MTSLKSIGTRAGLGLQTKTYWNSRLLTEAQRSKDQFQQYHSSTHLQCQILNQFIKD
jgi:hypothetical protein